MSGRFITFEGGEGVGKSTQIKAVEKFLNSRGIATLLTREPGGTPMAEALRELVVSGDTDRWSPLEEMLIMYTARSELVRTVIKPALEKGVWVLADRFADSTTVYQGYAGGVPLKRIKLLHEIVLGSFTPNLTFIIDLCAKNGLKRVRSRAEIISRFEKHSPEFYDKVRQGYLEIAKKEPDRCHVIDGSGSISEISSYICKVMASKFAFDPPK
ncbi:dTMP kinase [Oceanicaulis sp. AH-315-P02]|nr:dTMP kinase [Oceanicaulis sp. AH-315-P02]